MKVDLEAVRDRVTCGAVLRAAGYDLPDRGRACCMVHNGDNPTALSWNERQWICFGCNAGGDIFTLAGALFGVDFPRALRIVARIGGIDLGRALSETEQREIEKRATIAARRNALAEWRRVELGGALTRQGNLDHEARRIADRLRKARERGDELEIEAWFDVLGVIFEERDSAEYLAARLTPEDERAWLAVWREQKGSTCASA